MTRIHGPYCDNCESAPCACPWEERRLEWLSEADWEHIAQQDEADAERYGRWLEDCEAWSRKYGTEF